MYIQCDVTYSAFFSQSTVQNFYTAISQLIIITIVMNSYCSAYKEYDSIRTSAYAGTRANQRTIVKSSPPCHDNIYKTNCKNMQQKYRFNYFVQLKRISLCTCAINRNQHFLFATLRGRKGYFRKVTIIVYVLYLLYINIFKIIALRNHGAFTKDIINEHTMCIYVDCRDRSRPLLQFVFIFGTLLCTSENKINKTSPLHNPIQRRVRLRVLSIYRNDEIIFVSFQTKI